MKKKYICPWCEKGELQFFGDIIALCPVCDAYKRVGGYWETSKKKLDELRGVKKWQS